jgi:hypothetical protein
VGIGTWSPAANLEIEFTETTETEVALLVENTNSTIGGDLFKVTAGGDAYFKGNLELGSSRMYKSNIRALSAADALQAVQQLQPVTYNHKANPAEQVLGFIAEDVPDLVATDGRQSINPMDFVAVLTKVVQKQQTTITELSARVAELERQLHAGEQQ